MQKTPNQYRTDYFYNRFFFCILKTAACKMAAVCIGETNPAIHEAVFSSLDFSSVI